MTQEIIMVVLLLDKLLSFWNYSFAGGGGRGGKSNLIRYWNYRKDKYLTCYPISLDEIDSPIVNRFNIVFYLLFAFHLTSRRDCSHNHIQFSKLPPAILQLNYQAQFGTTRVRTNSKYARIQFNLARIYKTIILIFTTISEFWCNG